MTTHYTAIGQEYELIVAADGRRLLRETRVRRHPRIAFCGRRVSEIIRGEKGPHGACRECLAGLRGRPSFNLQAVTW